MPKNFNSNCSRLILGFAGMFVLAVTLSCGSTKKKSDSATTTDSTTTDAENEADKGKDIVNKEMSFDTAGSDSGNINGLQSVNFEYDEVSLSAESKRRLAENAKWMKTNKGLSVQVEGHCDERGSIEYNLALGERRAKAAKAYLVSMGVEGKRLSVISYGKERPLDKGDSEASLAKNRRANFVPLPK